MKPYKCLTNFVAIVGNRVCDGSNDAVLQVNNNRCCKKVRPCVEGQGDCNSDSECAGDLKCGKNNCRRDFSSTKTRWGSKLDCCFCMYTNV